MGCLEHGCERRQLTEIWRATGMRGWSRIARYRGWLVREQARGKLACMALQECSLREMRECLSGSGVFHVP